MDDDWMFDAECRGIDPELWFPERGANAKDAKAVCRACPVRDECLGYALRNGIKHGIWGGVGERERRRMRPARAAA